jgi:hypothetical protein
MFQQISAQERDQAGTLLPCNKDDPKGVIPFGIINTQFLVKAIILIAIFLIAIIILIAIILIALSLNLKKLKAGLAIGMTIPIMG